MIKVTVPLFILLNLFLLSNIQSQSIAESELFIINPARDTIIKTINGAKISISAYCFSNMESIVDSSEYVMLRVEEAFDIDDMILSDLSTETKEGLLLSDGMIRIEAKSKGQKLILGPDKFLDISLPTSRGVDQEMNLYVQDENNEFWIKQEDTLVFNDCELKINQVIWDYQKSTKQEYKKWERETPEIMKPTERLFGGKFVTIRFPNFSKKEYFIPIPIDTTWTCVEKDTAFYKLQMYTLNWHNIDKPFKVRKQVRVKVKCTHEGNVEAYLVVKNRKICLNGRKRGDMFFFKDVSKNTNIALVCYKQIKKDQILYSIEEFKAVEDIFIEVEVFEESSVKLFKQKIKNVR